MSLGWGLIFMNIRNEQRKQEKRKLDEYKKNPIINLSDSINRSKIGDLGELTKGGCLTRIISTVIIIGILLMISQCSS